MSAIESTAVVVVGAIAAVADNDDDIAPFVSIISLRRKLIFFISCLLENLLSTHMHNIHPLQLF